MVSLLEIFIGLFLLRFVWLRLCLGSHSALELKCTIGPVGLSLFFLWFLWPLSGPSQPLIPHFLSFFMSPHLFLCSFAMSLNLLKLSLLPACDHIITPILKKYFCVYLMCVCVHICEDGHVRTMMLCGGRRTAIGGLVFVFPLFTHSLLWFTAVYSGLVGWVYSLTFAI